MHTLFISDLHLAAERPHKLDLFRRFLRGRAREADALYILGDLFEAWAGDDDATPPHPEIINELAEYSRTSRNLFIMRGNRDFLMGDRFLEATGGSAIVDPLVIDLYGTPVLLMHGDTLCTDDTRYQVYRKLVNNRPVISLFMMFPWRLREKIWHGVRGMTRRSKARKSPEITDVNQAAVEETLREWKVLTLIHGHTHRPGTHVFQLDGNTARRYVIGDWYEEDSVLVADAGSLQLMRVEEYLTADF